MLGKIPAARVALIDAIISAAQSLRRFKQRSLERDYLRSYFHGVCVRMRQPASRPSRLAIWILAGQGDVVKL